MADEVVPRPMTLVATFALGLALSAVLGGVTNAVNAGVSPDYFRIMLGWDELRELRRAVVAQGVFEGALGGVALSLLFTVGLGWITRASASFATAARHVAGAASGALAGWAVGGALAVGLAAFSPEFFRATVWRAPAEGLLGFAWVGGSIQGAWVGALVGVALALTALRAAIRGPSRA